MATKYGIISDIHRIDPRYVGLAMKTLVDKGIQKLILNGDIVGDQFDDLNEQNYLANLFQSNSWVWNRERCDFS